MSPKYTMPLFQPAPPSPEQHKPASMEAQRSARLTEALDRLRAAVGNMDANAMQEGMRRTPAPVAPTDHHGLKPDSVAESNNLMKKAILEVNKAHEVHGAYSMPAEVVTDESRTFAKHTTQQPSNVINLPTNRSDINQPTTYDDSSRGAQTAPPDTINNFPDLMIAANPDVAPTHRQAA